MKYLLVLSALFLFSACGSMHHDHSEGMSHEHSAGSSCSAGGGEHKEGASAAHCGCEKMKDHKCSSDCKEKSAMGASCKADGMGAASAAVPAVSGDELKKIYSVNKKKLGKTCAPAASAHCGKVTRDLNITETELTCLMGKVNRTTEEALPKLDGTECAKLIKSFAAPQVKAQ